VTLRFLATEHAESLEFFLRELLISVAKSKESDTPHKGGIVSAGLRRIYASIDADG
jgi:hypothetical protein